MLYHTLAMCVCVCVPVCVSVCAPVCVCLCAWLRDGGGAGGRERKGEWDCVQGFLESLALG